MMRQIEEIADRMDDLRAPDLRDRAERARHATERANLRKELRDLMILTQESPQKPPQAASS